MSAGNDASPIMHRAPVVRLPTFPESPQTDSFAMKRQLVMPQEPHTLIAMMDER